VGQPAIFNLNLTDWVGTRRLTTDFEGTVSATCLSLPFGNGETCTAVPTEHLFASEERDSESENDYFGARYYGSSLGRFLSPDPGWFGAANPEDPQTWNLYNYALNNPLTIVDSDGYDCVYLDKTGYKIETIDTNSDSDECSKAGGYWVDGTVTQVNLYTNTNDVGLTGYTAGSNGSKTETSDFYTNADTPENQYLLSAMGYVNYHGTVDMIQLANYRMAHPLGSLYAASTSDIVMGCSVAVGKNLLLDLLPHDAGMVPDTVNGLQKGSSDPVFNTGDRLHDAGNAVGAMDVTAKVLKNTLPLAEVLGKVSEVVGPALSVSKASGDLYDCIKHG
jgi:RHS repeat-associated protein